MDDERESWCVDCGAVGHCGVCPACIEFGEADPPAGPLHESRR